MLDVKYNKVNGNSGYFLQTAQGGTYELNNEIQINRTALRSLIRYSGTGKGISLSFDSDNLGKSVIFDKKNETLKITEIPLNLLMQLKED